MRDYYVNCKFVVDRLENLVYEKRNEIAEKFSIGKFDGGCGNIESNFRFDLQFKKWVFLDQTSYDYKNQKFLYEVIPSALLLYRLMCTFPECDVKSYGKDGYKVVWHYPLVHIETNSPFYFGEWKGAASLGSNFVHPNEVPLSFGKDVCELMDYLCGDCVHPYDGLLAGSVA